MKQVFLIVLIVCNYAFAKAQHTQTQKVKAPTIGVKLMYGHMVSFGDTQIKFKSVITDSRCPKGVRCVWAGEAKVLVEVYKNEKLDLERELTFTAINRDLAILDTESLQVKALRLQPYPITMTSKNIEEYYLVLGMQEN